MPPVGPVYRQRVYVDLALAGEDDIAFDGGTHSQAICMRWPDFAAAVQPTVGRFAERPLDGVGGFDVG
jgi:Ala-tRNA(Pro) deacylase